MNIVIKIDDHEYEKIKEDAEKFRSKGMVVPYLYKVIESGKPLPKTAEQIKHMLRYHEEYEEAEEELQR